MRGTAADMGRDRDITREGGLGARVAVTYTHTGCWSLSQSLDTLPSQGGDGLWLRCP